MKIGKTDLFKMKKLLAKFKNLSLPARASLAYTLANLVSKGVSVITVPIFTRMLTTSEVGVGTTYSSWYSILYTVITLALTSGSVNIAMMEYDKNRDEYESACLTLSSISGVIFLLIVLLFSSYLSAITTLSKPILLLMAISIIVNPALDFWYARQRFEYKYISSVIVSISVTVLSAVLAVMAILMYRYSSVNLGEVKVIAQGIVLIAAGCIAYIYIFVKGRTFVNLQIWKNALIWSLPLIVHTVSKSILDVSDRIMIVRMCGQSEAGIYGTIYSLAMLSLIVWNAINTSLIPTTFEHLKKGEYQKENTLIKSVLLIFGVVAILVTLFAPEILLMFTTKEYMQAVYLVPALSSGIYFTAVYNIYGNFLLYKKKTTYIMISTVIAAFSNLVMNYIYIRIYGYMAAAYTTLASFIILALIQSWLCYKEFKAHVINEKAVFVLSSVVVVLCLLCNLIYRFYIIRYLIIIAILIIACLNRRNIIKYFIHGKKD